MTTITKPERPHFTSTDHEASGAAMSTRVSTTVTVVSGSAYTFSIADFDLLGGSGMGLAAVHIAGLERHGTLLLRGGPVDLNEVVTREEIDAGQLQFFTGHAADGTESDSFLFTTHDGSQWSGSPMSMAVHATTAEEMTHDEVTTKEAYASPVALDGCVATSEGTPYSFKPTDFNFQGAEGSFEYIKFVSLETCGLLLVDGVEATFGQVVSVEDLKLDMLTFEPQEPGKEGFEFKVHDGTSWSEATYSMMIEVTPFYHPPTASDNVIETPVDTAYVFQASDFKYHDFDGDELIKVKITNLDMKGAVRLDGVPIDPNQVVSRSEIEQGSFDYSPAEKGESDSFWFQVHDGTTYSNDKYRMTVKILTAVDVPVYDAPAYDDEGSEDAYVEDVIADSAPLPDVDVPEVQQPTGDLCEEAFEETDEEDLAAAYEGETPDTDDEADTGDDVATGEPTLDSDCPGPESGLYPTTPSGSEEGAAWGSQPRQRMQRHYDLTVTTKEDSAYIFSALDLSPDSTPVSEVQIVSMDICGLLQLDGMAVTPGQRITQADLEDGRLTFIPATVGTHKYFDFKMRRGPKWSIAKCSMMIEVIPVYNHTNPSRRL